jgi:hypothetical protein
VIEICLNKKKIILFLFLPAGKSMAIKYGCKYIETSPGINHNVDELLVGMLAQIQLRGQSKKSLDLVPML